MWEKLFNNGYFLLQAKPLDTPSDLCRANVRFKFYNNNNNCNNTFICGIPFTNKKQPKAVTTTNITRNKTKLTLKEHDATDV